MNTILKRLIFMLLAAVIGVLIYMYSENVFTPKQLSPKDTVAFKLNDLKLNVFYNRPSKRNRDIFGGLVPYNQVWRTGANEATTFETNTNLKIGNQMLPAGKYTLWTIPNDTLWQVMFNSKQYPWGVDETMTPMREPDFDTVTVSVKPESLNTIVEQFTIAFDNSTDNLSLTMAWDRTKISIPLQR